MSLKIWITGNGSIENLGSGTLSGNLYGSPVYEAGKMGKCLRTNFVRSSTLSCEELAGATNYSISFWFKIRLILKYIFLIPFLKKFLGIKLSLSQRM